MRGLGIGILLTTIILSISYHSSLKDRLSDEEIIKRAEELGMQYVEEKDPNEILTTPTKTPENEDTKDTIEESTKEELTDQTTEQTEEEIKTQTVEEFKTQTEEETEEQEQIKDETEDQLTTKSVDKTEDAGTVVIEIKRGMHSEEVATLLKNYGVIEDNKDFNQYLIKKGYASVINYGVYTFPLDASYEQITDLIIK